NAGLISTLMVHSLGTTLWMTVDNFV
ncbi:MAG: hypothetical protein QOD41_2427, partial [Cryptosporangiaceae bacterium]|nr:hypothetical protein [Cryptosporangiaceae bacterium]